MTLPDPFACLLKDHFSEPLRLPSDVLIWVHRGERVALQQFFQAGRESREHQVQEAQTSLERLTR